MSSRSCSRSAIVKGLTERRLDSGPDAWRGTAPGRRRRSGRRRWWRPRQAGDAEANGDGAVGERMLLDDGADALGIREAARFGGVHEDDRKLVAAVPRDDAEAPRVLHQELGDVPQRLVAGAVTEPVVDLFEVIEIHEGQGERLAEAAVPLELFLHADREVPAGVHSPAGGPQGKNPPPRVSLRRARPP